MLLLQLVITRYQRNKSGFLVLRGRLVLIVLDVLIILVMQNKHFNETPNEFSHFESFDQLAKDTFDLSFKEWKEAGYLTQKYRPYTHIKDGKVVANASANLMYFVMEGQRWSAIQIGTVMTAPEYRNQGLAKTLIQQIINEWRSKVDFIYLFSNDDTTSFYPQFDFERIYEYAYSHKITVLGTPPKYRKLKMSDESDLSILKEKYRIGNPFSAFESVHNFELLLFYCGSFMSESVYYLEEYDLVVILQKEENERKRKQEEELILKGIYILMFFGQVVIRKSQKIQFIIMQNTVCLTK